MEQSVHFLLSADAAVSMNYHEEQETLFAIEKKKALYVFFTTAGMKLKERANHPRAVAYSICIFSLLGLSIR